MMVRLLVVPILVGILFSPACSNAGNLEDDLAKARSQGKIVMIEIGSVGCIPCERMKPVMEKLRTNYQGKLEVFFVDVKKDRDASRRYGVFIIPTQVFLDKNGKEFSRHVGYYPFEEIVPVLKKAGL
jgi:thioredoxin 1